MQMRRFHLPPAPPARVRVFAASDLHITLGFIGAVQESDARKAWDQIERVASFRQVQGSFSGVEPRGHPRKPSALAAMVVAGRDAGSVGVAEARAPLVGAAGAREDGRPPLPHVTLARIQRRARAAERREALRWARSIDLRGVTFAAAAVALYTWAEDRQERLFQIVERYDFDR